MNTLDCDEHFYLALNAISEKSHERAILHLKEIVEGEFFFKARYLLAAEYAEIGMYDRAKQLFESVVHVDLLGKIALFQKGLLHLYLGEKPEAQLIMKKIIETETEENYLFWFAKGINFSFDGNLAEAIQMLEKGIALNNDNQPLNQDMKNYVNNITDNSISPDTSLKTESMKNSNKFLLNNYEDS